MKGRNFQLLILLVRELLAAIPIPSTKHAKKKRCDSEQIEATSATYEGISSNKTCGGIYMQNK
jgi:hypothetical protein